MMTKAPSRLSEIGIDFHPCTSCSSSSCSSSAIRIRDGLSYEVHLTEQRGRLIVCAHLAGAHTCEVEYDKLFTSEAELTDFLNQNFHQFSNL